MFLIKYRWLIILGVPLLFFLIITLLVFSPRKDPSSSGGGVTPTPFNNTIQQRSLNIPPSTNINNNELEEPLENRPGFIGTDILPDTTIRYSFSSHLPERPHIIITGGGYDFVFQRNITLPDFPIKISDYTSVDGPPGWIFQGSNFYGDRANTYIYPDLGVAFIANPDTEEVLEQHLFEPTTVEEYVRKYGDDIPAKPEP